MKTYTETNLHLKVYHNIADFEDIHKPIITVGTFDGVHIGHQRILNRLKEIALKTGGETVLLTFFPHPRMILFPDSHGLKLINTLNEKIDLLGKFGLDHLIILPFDKSFSQTEPETYVKNFLIDQINVHTIVIGYDHQFGKNRKGNLSLLNKLAPKYHFSVEEISAQEIDEIKVSSTKIRSAITNGSIKIASQYLNHHFCLEGKVVKGEQIGRTIGFPTANLSLEFDYKIIPAKGVYAITSFIDGKTYAGMLNIGNRPTVTNENKTTIEAHFFDLNKDLYDTVISITFIEKLRDEMKFNTLEDLKLQLHIDQLNALKILTPVDA